MSVKKKREIITARDVATYLASPGKTVEAYRHELESRQVELEYYRTNVVVDHTQRKEILTTKQGSAEWLRNRVGACTASNAGAYVGHSPYDSPLHLAKKLVQNKSTLENVFTRFGHEIEPYGREYYQARIRRIVLSLWEEARRKGQDTFRYRRRTFSATGDAPILEVKADTGSIVHQQYDHLRCSMDGLIYLNGILIGILEIKSSLAGTHWIMKLAHFDQIQFMLYVIKSHWQDVDECDYAVCDGLDESIEPIRYNQEYTETWLMPRIQRFYFKLLLPGLAHMTVLRPFLCHAGSKEDDASTPEEDPVTDAYDLVTAYKDKS